MGNRCSGFVAKELFNPVPCFGKRWWHGLGNQDLLIGGLPAQFKLKAPALRSGVGDAPKLKRPYFGQDSPQVDRNISGSACAALKQGVNRRQGVQVVRDNYNVT